MLGSLKALIVVLGIGAAIFLLGRPISAGVCAPADYSRRFAIWFVLTIAAFVCGSFWLFATIAIPIVIWGGYRDANPVALYLLLMNVIPDMEFEIPIAGVNSLFSLNLYRILAIFLLLPQLWKNGSKSGPKGEKRFDVVDWLILGYGALQVCLYFSDESITASLRRIFLFYIDVYVVYAAVRRLCTTTESITEAQFCFFISCMLMAAMSVYESMSSWLLYSEMYRRWGIDSFLAGFYNFRGSSLRGTASSGNTLALAYLIAVAVGFNLYLATLETAKSKRRIGFVILIGGLIATFSRGPWLGCLLIFLIFSLMRYRSLFRLRKYFVAGLAGILLIRFTPLWGSITSILPFMGGTVDIDTIQYREALATRAWELVQEHPFFGDINVMDKLEDLRQGVGIIDLVNTYFEVALYTGTIGLFLFLASILVPLSRAFRRHKGLVAVDSRDALLGASLISCIIGTLLMIATCSFILGYQKLYYVLAGMAAAYAGISSPVTGGQTKKLRG